MKLEVTDVSRDVESFEKMNIDGNEGKSKFYFSIPVKVLLGMGFLLLLVAAFTVGFSLRKQDSSTVHSNSDETGSSVDEVSTHKVSSSATYSVPNSEPTHTQLIARDESTSSTLASTSVVDIRKTKEKIKELELRKEQAVSVANYELAAKLKVEIGNLENTLQTLKDRKRAKLDLTDVQHKSLDHWSDSVQSYKAYNLTRKRISAGLVVVQALVEYMIDNGVRTMALQQSPSVFRSNPRDPFYGFSNIVLKKLYGLSDDFVTAFSKNVNSKIQKGGMKYLGYTDICVYQDFTFGRRPFINKFWIGETSKIALEVLLQEVESFSNKVCDEKSLHSWEITKCEDTVQHVKKMFPEDQLVIYRNILSLQESITAEEIAFTSSLLEDKVAMPFLYYQLLNTTTLNIGFIPETWPVVVQLWSDEDCDTVERAEACFYKNMMKSLDSEFFDHSDVVWFS